MYLYIMNIIVDRPQLVRAVLLYLNMNFGDLIQKTYLNIPDKVFYVNKHGETVLEYEENNEYGPAVWFDTRLIWSRIENAFHLNYNEIQSILEVWLKEKPYELEGVSANHIRLNLDFDFD